MTLDQQRIQEAFPSHKLLKECKHYYAREALSFPSDHPLRHPKLGASFQVNRWNGKLGVTEDDLEQLNRELEETVVSLLADAGIDVRPDTVKHLQTVEHTSKMRTSLLPRAIVTGR